MGGGGGTAGQYPLLGPRQIFCASSELEMCQMRDHSVHFFFTNRTAISCVQIICPYSINLIITFFISTM